MRRGEDSGGAEAEERTVSDTIDTVAAWQQVVDAKPGTILLDRFDEGLRFLIIRGPFNLCAYVGVPETHPLANHNYDNLPVECHGGLTFAELGGQKGEIWPKGFFWYGWDYGHCDDYSVRLYHDDPAFADLAAMREKHKKWTVADVDKDSWNALWDFKKLAKLAEVIHSRAKGETIT